MVKISAPNVFAITTPDFPTCTNPEGSLRVQYNEGTHGVVGKSSEFRGKDSVYTVNDSQVLQCLCTDDGQGIQTNWWKISSLTDSQVQTLKNLGWYLVPNGASWGLDSAQYMAKNSNYSCKDGVGGGDVLGLASTGNSAFIFGVFISGLVLLLSGLFFAFGKRR